MSAIAANHLQTSEGFHAFSARYLHFENFHDSKQMCGVIGYSLRGWAISVIVSLRLMQSLSFFEHFWRAY